MQPARALAALLSLLVAGHVGILLAADLEPFLVGENIALAALYGASAALALEGYRLGVALAVGVSLFSAGRVSRSIVGPRGEVGELAARHVPLLAIDLAVGLLGLAMLY